MRSGHIPRYASTVSIQVRSQLEQVGGCSDCQVHQVGYLASVVSHAANSSILLQDSPTLFTGFDCKFYSYIDEMRDGSQFTAFDQLTPQVSMTFSHLNWANKNDFGAISGLDTSRFGALITGYVYCHTSGQYEFKTSSDDGSWLWIDEAFVIENGGRHGMREREGSLYLSAGYHWCRIQLFDSGGGAGLIVRYKGPDTNEVWTLLPGYNTGSEQASSSAVLLPPPQDSVHTIVRNKYLPMNAVSRDGGLILRLSLSSRAGCCAFNGQAFSANILLSSLSRVHSVCQRCQTGYYQSFPKSTSCTACAIGWYQDMAGSTSCKRCPNNTFTTGTASPSVHSCKCNAGYVLTGVHDPPSSAGAGSMNSTHRQFGYHTTLASFTAAPAPSFGVGRSCSSCEIGKFRNLAMPESEPCHFIDPKRCIDLLVGQQCADGNRRPHDGCDAHCWIEVPRPVNGSVSRSGLSSGPGTITIAWKHTDFSIDAHYRELPHRVLHYNLVIHRSRRNSFSLDGQFSNREIEQIVVERMPTGMLQVYDAKGGHCNSTTCVYTIQQILGGEWINLSLSAENVAGMSSNCTHQERWLTLPFGSVNASSAHVVDVDQANSAIKLSWHAPASTGFGNSFEVPVTQYTLEVSRCANFSNIDSLCETNQVLVTPPIGAIALSDSDIEAPQNSQYHRTGPLLSFTGTPEPNDFRKDSVVIRVQTTIPDQPGCLFECGGRGRGTFVGIVKTSSDALQFRFCAAL